MKLSRGELTVLTEDELEKIHQSSLEILCTTGINVGHEESLNLLAEAGANVNYEEKLAKIPSSLVNEALEKCPDQFTLYGRDPGYQLNFSAENPPPYFSMEGSPSNLIDLDSGEKRKATLEDLDKFYRLADALDNVDHAGCAVWPTDIPASISHAHVIFSAFANTTKTVDGVTRGGVHSNDALRMASVIAGSEEKLKEKPRLLGYVQSVSPLRYEKAQEEGLIAYAKARQPIIIVPWPLGGVSAPVTLAGELTQLNAEVLGDIVIAQLTNPGTPIIYGGCPTSADLQTLSSNIGGIELGLMDIAIAQLGRYYNLPTRGTAGSTDSKVLDIQAGYEKGLPLLLAALSGVNLINHAIGSVESTMAASYVASIIDDEVAGMIRWLVTDQFPVNSETIALDTIDEVHSGDSFITHPHTLRHFKKLYNPELFNKETRETWQKNGSKTTTDRARQKAKHLIDNHQPPPLAPSIESELKKVIEEIERRELS